MDERSGYGTAGHLVPPALEEREERLWSALAHLSIFLNLFTGVLGPLAALVIWLVYKDRSETVRFQALQAALYQVAWLLVLGVGWTVTGALTVILVGFLLIPLMAVLSVVPFAHAAYAAYRVGEGRAFRYPFVADLIQPRA